MATEEMAYLGLCIHGKARAIVIDDPNYRRDTAKCVSEYISDGLTVIHCIGAEARQRIAEKCEPCDEKRCGRK